MSSGPLDLPWLAWAGLAWGVALIFTLVVPRAAGTTGVQYVILRWFHALVWLLLGASALVRGFWREEAQLADFMALTALAVYITFLATYVRVRS